jgi:hypothetical protein
MKILMRRSGGFAGLDETLAEVDTAKLERGEAAMVERLVGQLESGSRALSPEKQRVGADFIKYEVAVTDGQSSHDFKIADDGSSLSALARQLAERLARLR